MSTALGFTFNAADVEPTKAYEPIPLGTYVMHAIEASRKTSSAGTDYIELVLEVMEGDYAGRRYYERLNFWHEKDSVQEIAQRTLSAMCRATGSLMIVEDAEQLLFLPMVVKMNVTPRKDTRELQNRAAYIPADEAEAALKGGKPATRPAFMAAAPAPARQPDSTPPSARVAPTAATRPTTGAAPPWKTAKAS